MVNLTTGHPGDDVNITQLLKTIEGIREYKDEIEADIKGIITHVYQYTCVMTVNRNC